MSEVILINAVTFLFFVSDKRRAKKDKRRIREATLMGLAAFGGSVGALAAMYLVRHKTKKPLFAVGIPIILVLQITAVFFTVNYLF